MKILQEEEKLSEESAKIYLEEAEEAIKRIDEYTVFIKSLCEIISDLKKQTKSGNWRRKDAYVNPKVGSRPKI